MAPSPGGLQRLWRQFANAVRGELADRRRKQVAGAKLTGSIVAPAPPDGVRGERERVIGTACDADDAFEQGHLRRRRRHVAQRCAAAPCPHSSRRRQRRGAVLRRRHRHHARDIPDAHWNLPRDGRTIAQLLIGIPAPTPDCAGGGAGTFYGERMPRTGRDPAGAHKAHDLHGRRSLRRGASPSCPSLIAPP